MSEQQRITDLLRDLHGYIGSSIPQTISEHCRGCDLLDRIDSVLAGQTIGRTLTEDQEFELTTVLQSIANGFSDDPANDAATLLKLIAGEVPWTGDSFLLPPRQGGEPCDSASLSFSPA